MTDGTAGSRPLHPARPVRVAVLDYGAGNLRSVDQALVRAGAETWVAERPEAVDEADAIVVPGVGHFGQCAGALAEGFGDLMESWIGEQRPVLGICVGMQVLYATSEEDPGARGLGLLPGAVVRLPGDVVVPHMGWDVVRVVRDEPAVAGIDGERLYFANSYCAEPSTAAHVLAVCDYGPGFPCVVRTGSVIGTQFHPEKSGDVGARMLAGWVASLSGARAAG